MKPIIPLLIVALALAGCGGQSGSPQTNSGSGSTNTAPINSVGYEYAIPKTVYYLSTRDRVSVQVTATGATSEYVIISWYLDGVLQSSKGVGTLAPGQTMTAEFPIYNYGDAPGDHKVELRSQLGWSATATVNFPPKVMPKGAT